MTATINNIKETFEELVGEKLIVTVDAGRGRKIIHEGVLTETYPSLFVVELDDGEDSYERVSFSYADVLTDSIDIDFPENPEVLFNQDDEEKK